MKDIEKRYQIFISSTYNDLIEERKKVVQAILKLYHLPIGMEMFHADNEEQWVSDKKDNRDVRLLCGNSGTILRNAYRRRRNKLHREGV